MTPMYLMQQPEGDEGQPHSEPLEKTTESSNSQLLSPYSLERQMRLIMTQFPEVNVTYDIIGRTVEYNNILLMKITEQKSEIGKYFRAEESKYIDEIPEKKIIFIVHGLSVMGLHSLNILDREKYIKTLLSYYMAYLDKFDIFLIPMANPDGYITSHFKSMWNKNMSPQNACNGVALDRNFDIAWNGSKVSSCSQLYAGPSAFSEPETRAVRDVLHHYGHKIMAYIHVHAGVFSTNIFKGEAVLYPKGYSEVQSDDDKYIDLKAEIDEAMKNASFQVMTVTVDTIHNWYGRVTGTSVDYASTVYGIPYALEFVMQLYENNPDFSGTEEYVDHNALTEIWRRVIEVVFNNIWRNINTNEVR